MSNEDEFAKKFLQDAEEAYKSANENDLATIVGKVIGVIICIILALVLFSWFPIITSIVLILAFIGWITEKKAS